MCYNVASVQDSKLKIKIEVEIDTVEDREELEELIEQLTNLKDLISQVQEFNND